MPRIGFDWARLTKWCVIGAIAMVVWLVVPVASCSWHAFRDTPLGELDPNAPAQTDKSRVDAGRGFWDELGTATEACYAKTPLLGQEPWKTSLLFAFVAIGAAAWAMGRITSKRQPYV